MEQNADPWNRPGRLSRRQMLAMSVVVSLFILAMALLPSDQGTCLVPLDASTGVRGGYPRTAFPSMAPRFRPGRSVVRRSGDVKEPGGVWSTPSVHNNPSPREQRIQMNHVMRQEKKRKSEDIRMMEGAIKKACRAMNKKSPSQLRGLHRQELTYSEHMSALQDILGEILPRKRLVGTYLALLRGEYNSVTNIPPRVQELLDAGLASMRTSERYLIAPR